MRDFLTKIIYLHTKILKIKIKIYIHIQENCYIKSSRRNYRKKLLGQSRSMFQRRTKTPGIKIEEPQNNIPCEFNP